MRRGILAIAVCAAVLVLISTPTACYLSRGAWEEAKILSRRQPISEIVSDPRTPPDAREKLKVVLAARSYAKDSLRLRTKDSFTTYSRLDHDTLVLVVSAAYRDTLKPYTWWFPIVGRVPYKGYFDFGAAKKAAKDLYDDGLDVYVRPSDAFSTLGFFNDPLLNTTLRGDSIDLANTVIHELTHNTFYASGQAPFNESFAMFVGVLPLTGAGSGSAESRRRMGRQQAAGAVLDDGDQVARLRVRGAPERQGGEDRGEDARQTDRDDAGHEPAGHVDSDAHLRLREAVRHDRHDLRREEES